MNYVHIAQRVFNVPLMIEEYKLAVILEVLLPRMGMPTIELSLQTDDEAARMQAARSKGTVSRVWPHEQAAEKGIAVIDVSGTLVNRYATAPSGMLSYDRLRDRIHAAAADRDIRGILMRFDTPGGEVAGAFDTADVIREVAKQKPIWAAIDDAAFSAGFLMASQAQRIVMSRTAGVGSVGTIAVHMDLSEKNAREGIKPTIIVAGAKKAMLSPLVPITDEAVSFVKGEVEAHYNTLVDYVAAGRRLSSKAVRDTEAGLFFREDGIRSGFADAAGTFEQALEDLAAMAGRTSVFVSGGTTAKGEASTMEQAADQAVGNTANETVGLGISTGTISLSSNGLITGFSTATVTPSLDQVRSEARAEERTRINAILSSPEAKGREKLAHALALTTDLSAEAAEAVLRQSEKATPAIAGLAARIPENPRVGVDARRDGDEAEDAAQSIIAAGQRAGIIRKAVA